MSDLNAPQPAAPGAEVFDATISGVAPQQISQDQLPGPGPQEAVVHVAQVNTYDVFIQQRYFVFNNITWNKNMTPGTLLMAIPIHPSQMHQWMNHLNLMYNEWTGGFDFAVKVAGTGFHAGSIMITRLPPNVDPSNFYNTMDVSCWPFQIIDPKTLQVFSNHAFDQRNVLYHYNPLDPKRIETFGGWFAIYVNQALNTGASGTGQIDIQVLVKPSQEFAFGQLMPISRKGADPINDRGLEQYLDFTTSLKHSVIDGSIITELLINSGKTIKILDKQTPNCFQTDGTPMNGYYIPAFSPLVILKPKNYNSAKWIYVNSDTARNVFDYPEGDTIFAWDEIKIDDDVLPNLEGKGIMTFWWEYRDRRIPLKYFGTFAETQSTDPEDIRSMKHKFTFDLVSHDETYNWLNYSYTKETFNFNPPPATRFEVFGTYTYMRDNFLGVTIEIENGYKFDWKEYAPPIPESIVTFKSETNQEHCQFAELADVFAFNNYVSLFGSNQSVLYQLIDTQVSLPIFILKLHKSGYFTAPLQETDVILKLLPKRKYRLKYYGKVAETDPIQKTDPNVNYALNYAVSVMHSPLESLNNVLNGTRPRTHKSRKSRRC